MRRPCFSLVIIKRSMLLRTASRTHTLRCGGHRRGRICMKSHFALQSIMCAMSYRLAKGKAASQEHMRRGGVIKHQQCRRQPRQSTTVKRRAAAADKEQRHSLSFADDYVTTTLQCPRCLIVRLTGTYGQDLSWT